MLDDLTLLVARDGGGTMTKAVEFFDALDVASKITLIRPIRPRPDHECTAVQSYDCLPYVAAVITSEDYALLTTDQRNRLIDYCRSVED